MKVRKLEISPFNSFLLAEAPSLPGFVFNIGFSSPSSLLTSFPTGFYPSLCEPPLLDELDAWYYLNPFFGAAQVPFFPFRFFNAKLPLL